MTLTKIESFDQIEEGDMLLVEFVLHGIKLFKKVKKGSDGCFIGQKKDGRQHFYIYPDSPVWKEIYKVEK